MSELYSLTGIAELDRLLGLKDKRRDDTISILIRGGQGAGKTTLALQILSTRLSQNIKGPNNKVLDNSHNYGLFLSLERSAHKTLDYVQREFDLFRGMERFGPADVGKKVVTPYAVVGMDGDNFKEAVKKSLKNRYRTNEFLTATLDLLDFFFIPFKEFIAYFKRRLKSDGDSATGEHKEAIKNDLAAAIAKYIDIPKTAKERKNGEQDPTFWLVVDSLNVLERTIYLASEKEKYRPAMQGFAKSLQERLGMNVVIIFTGEYHTADHDVSGASGESFFCDIEILLSQEPVMGKARTDPRNSAAAGYNIELHHSTESHGGDASTGTHRDQVKDQVVVETRPFCRVLKSRFSKNQSRRCSYKIVEKKGFQFDEIFPGDGYMLLFEDNPKQREDWLDFLLKDAPHEFPALRFELFDRTHQQRVFSTERCFSGHRQDTDLHLATFDTYWIKWFTELGQRSTIGQFMQKKGLRDKIKAHREKFRPAAGESKASLEKLEEDVRRRFSKAISRIHQFFLDAASKNEDPDYIRLRNELKAMFGFDNDGFLSDGEIKECWCDFSKDTGILQPISKRDLRLFGEQRSPLLKKLLDDHKYIENKKDGTLISIPFNVNISFLVYRKDLLDAMPERVREAKGRNLKQEFCDRLLEILKEERKKTNIFIEDCWPKAKKAWRLKPTADGELHEITLSEADEKTKCSEIAERLGNENYVPETWEEIIALCGIFGWEYLIETRSFDTLLCTFLELVWGCGADLVVDAEYNLHITKDVLARIYQAIFLFQELLQHVPADATLDAQILGEYMGIESGNYTEKRKCGSDKGKKEDWGFMRQWHSTLVDILVAKGGVLDHHYWIPNPETELEISPLPESLWCRYQKNGKQSPRGISCWGDWHLAMLRGSENQSLAVGLINNIMSSSKISARALHGAALPAIEKFYEIYGKSPCVHLPERSGDLQMPAKSYDYVKSHLFPIARTRSNIFDYRHCMLEIHGFVVELVYNRYKRSPEDISTALINVFKEIKKLSERELLLH